MQILQAAVQEYSGDPRLTESLASTRTALTAKRREEAIATILRQAEAQQGQRDYEQALHSLANGLAEYGSDERLIAFREEIAAAKIAWERDEAIRQILARSQQLTAQNHLEAASEHLQSGLRQFPGEPGLAQAQASIEDALAAKRRDEAIVSLLQQAQAQSDERQYQPALDTLGRGLNEFTDDHRLVALHQRVASAKAQWERDEAVREGAAEAQNLLDQQAFDNAIALLESAETVSWRGSLRGISGLRSPGVRSQTPRSGD